MRCGLAFAISLLIFVPAAVGATPVVSIQTTPATGAAPLHVAFTATGDAASYRWDFGDGSSADGRTAEHTYAAGRWTATLTARSAGGETATQTTVITAYGLTPRRTESREVRPPRCLSRRRRAGGDRDCRVTLVGTTWQAARREDRRGWSLHGLLHASRFPGEYVATSERVESAPLALRIVPKLVTGLSGSGARDSRYFFTARLVPANAGVLAVSITRGQNVLVDRTFTGRVRIRLDTQRRRPPTGSARRSRRTRAMPARFACSARTSSCRGWLRRTRHCRLTARRPASASALRGAVRAGFDGRMLDAVYAFQKVHGLPRTGIVDARFWRALSNPRVADSAVRAAGLDTSR